MGGRCYTKESSKNNVREINSRDAVTGYRTQRRQGKTHIQYRETEIEIGKEREEEKSQRLPEKKGEKKICRA